MASVDTLASLIGTSLFSRAAARQNPTDRIRPGQLARPAPHLPWHEVMIRGHDPRHRVGRSRSRRQHENSTLVTTCRGHDNRAYGDVGSNRGTGRGAAEELYRTPRRDRL